MSSFNEAIMVGNLTRAPRSKVVAGDRTVTKFTLAINRFGKTKETDYIDIVTWDDVARTCATYLRAGSLVLVRGELKIKRYETAAGEKRKDTFIHAFQMRMLDRAVRSNADAPPGQAAASAGATATATATLPPDATDTNDEAAVISDDELERMFAHV